MMYVTTTHDITAQRYRRATLLERIDLTGEAHVDVTGHGLGYLNS